MKQIPGPAAFVRRGILVLVILIFAPFLLVLLTVALGEMLEFLKPVLCVLGPLVLLYGLWRGLLSRRY